MGEGVLGNMGRAGLYKISGRGGKKRWKRKEFEELITSHTLMVCG